MKSVAGCVIVSAMLLLAGCGGGAGNSTGAAVPMKTGADSAEAKQAMAVAQATAAKKAEDELVPPADATWTIACLQFKGPNHVESSKIFKEQVTAKTGWKEFYIVHEDEGSTLYYGFYRTIDPRGDDAKEGQRAQADLTKLKSLENSLGDQLFRTAGMQPLEPADPVAPPEWDLRNVDKSKQASDPTKAYFTLEIGVYKDSPLRKQAAVDSVKALRESGVANAYFYHGKTSSSVCIGTWPESAVVEKEPERGNPNDRILVAPPGMPDSMAQGLKDETGHAIRAVSITLVPVDPTLIDTMQKYDRRSVNGYDIKHTYKTKDGGVVDRYDPSLLTFIRRDEDNGMLGGEQRDPTIDATPNGQPANQPGGHLRSLDGSGGAQ